MVLVTGAGPVGLTMAMSLKRLGVDVRIIDRNAARTDKSKALVIWPRTLELLDIQGCAQAFVAAGMRGAGARMLAGGKEIVRVRFDTARSVFRYALLIPQSETERVLEEELARLGVRVERQVDLHSFAQDDHGVSVVLDGPNGRTENARVDWLMGCDGAHSAVRMGLGAQFEGNTLRSEWMLGDLRIDGPLPQDELTICWTEHGVLALFPMIGGRFRVIADMGENVADAAPPPTLEELQAVIAQRGPAGLTAHDAVWLSRFRINERKVRDYRDGRVFLAGDAAHIHSPAGGQGMNTGMQDAFNLAWKLALVVHGHAKPELLDSYSPERSAIGEQVLRNAGRLTEIGITRNRLLQELRNVAVSTLGQFAMVQQRIVDQLTEVDLEYPDSPLTQSPRGTARHPAGGERAVDVALLESDGGDARLHELLATGRFAVLSVGAPRVALPDALRALATSATAAETDHYDSGHVYLIRPDAYVAMSTGATDIGAILAALAQVGATTQ